MPIAIPLIAAGVGAAGAIGGAVISGNAQKKAAQAQTQSNQAALDLQKQEYDQSRADYAPWRDVGQGALMKLSSLYGITVPGGAYTPGVSATGTGAGTAGGTGPNAYGGFFASPDYQFRVDEGTRAITGNAAAKGLLDSGDLGKGLINYGQEAGSQEFGNWYNRLAALAGVGQTATNGTTQAGLATSANSSQILQDQGKQLASSYTAQGNNTAGLISGLGGIAGGLINRLPYGSGGGVNNSAVPADLAGLY